jgi:hypothetical protein
MLSRFPSLLSQDDEHLLDKMETLGIDDEMSLDTWDFTI